MRACWTLLRRELAGYFLSLTGYIIIAAAMFIVGFCLIDLLKTIVKEPSPMPITELFYVTAYLLIPVLMTPIITMRLFALEKFSGTFETLMTTPVSDLQVVLAKFSAALTFYVLMWLPLLACIFLVPRYSSNPAAVDYGSVGSTFIGVLLVGSLFISLGCCASALTRS